MGHPVLKFVSSDLESLRIASNLGESVLVESLPTPCGPVSVVAAGSLLFTRDSFITFWMWLCMGGKWYHAQISGDETAHPVFQDMRTLNPEIYHSFREQPNERFISFLFTILSRRLAKMDSETRFEIFQRVLDELD